MVANFHFGFVISLYKNMNRQEEEKDMIRRREIERERIRDMIGEGDYTREENREGK